MRQAGFRQEALLSSRTAGPMGMHYVSTRGSVPSVSFSQAVLDGLAGDGGLFVPDHIPQLPLAELQDLGYPQLAAAVMQPYTDLPAADLLQLCESAYGSDYGAEVAPLRSDPWGEQLELFHGPTGSFKDVALQFLGHLLDYLLRARNQHCNLLVATSGDTGSAALRAVHQRRRLQCVVMFPKGRVSPTQELQMTTMSGPNQWCLEIDGTFDECQQILKSLNRDAGLKQQLQLGAVNSVNWARLLAQSVYYVWVYLRTGRPLNVVVPTGNFGNFLSAWLAARMGVPVQRLALATNENDIVHRFFQSGIYGRGAVAETLAPAMDIQVASNLERYLYFLGGSDGNRVREWMSEFEQHGQVDLSELIPQETLSVASGCATREQILQAIRDYHQHTGIWICPHTAVAWHVAQTLPPLGPVTVVATAHPGKFTEALTLADSDSTGSLQQHPSLLALDPQKARKVSLSADPQAVAKWLQGSLVSEGNEI